MCIRDRGTPASSVPVPQHSLPARCMRTPYFARPRPPPAGLHAFCTLSFHFTGPRPHMAPPARCAQALHFAKLRPPANRAYPLYAGPLPRKAPPAHKQGPPAVRRPLVSQSHARPRRGRRPSVHWLSISQGRGSRRALFPCRGVCFLLSLIHI